MHDLGTLPGGTYSYAYGINSSGLVVGESYTSGDSWHAYLYSGSSMHDLGTLPGGYDSAAYGINQSGVIVGDAENSAGQWRAIVDIDGSMEDLNNLISPTSGWSLTAATAINDSGQIVGYGSNGDFLLTPMPEPSTLDLLAAGAIGLLGYAWRRRRGLPATRCS